jgi:ADP-glucose pyrophosphorylase
MFAKSYSFTFVYLQKDFEKDLQKNLQNKTSGAKVVQNVKNKRTIHAYPMSSYIGSILSNLCTYNYAN